MRTCLLFSPKFGQRWDPVAQKRVGWILLIPQRGTDESIIANTDRFAIGNDDVIEHHDAQWVQRAQCAERALNVRFGWAKRAAGMIVAEHDCFRAAGYDALQKMTQIEGRLIHSAFLQ